jgi:hypothetical protein
VLVVLLAPYVLIVAMPNAAENILGFVKDHSVEVKGIGSVCGYSLFDFERYGDERFAAPPPTATATTAEEEEQDNATSTSSSLQEGGVGGGVGGRASATSSLSARKRRQQERTEQGKMEKSFLNFKMHHPEWECGEKGDAFLNNLCDFQERQVRLLRSRRRLCRRRLCRLCRRYSSSSFFAPPLLVSTSVNFTTITPITRTTVTTTTASITHQPSLL